MPGKETTTQYFLQEWFMERPLKRRLRGNNKQVSTDDGAEEDANEDFTNSRTI